MPYRTPGIERALQYLADACASALGSCQPRLPALRSMAREAGVSNFTMWKAVHRLADKGDVLIRHGCPVEVAAVPSGAAPVNAEISRATPRRWVEVCAAVRRDVLEGVYAPGQRLPPIKQLLARYGVCHRTFHRALMQLLTEKVLERRNDRILVRRHVRHGRNRVLLIACGQPTGMLHQFSPLTQTHLNALETECVRRAYTLEICTIDLTGVAYFKRNRVNLNALVNRQLLGVFVWEIGIIDDAFTTILDTVKNAGISCVVLDEGRDYNFRKYQGSRKMRFFSLDNEYAGRAVARYCIQSGHRRMAYISDQKQNWSVLRFNGALAECNSWGGGCTILPFIAVGTGIDTLREGKRIPPVYGSIMNRIKKAFGTEHPSELRIELLMKILSQVEVAIQRETVPPAFTAILDGVLRTPGITAWICCNDDAALKSMEYALLRGKKIPGDLSIISFDDEPASWMYNLTSYNFNSPALICSMLSELTDSIHNHQHSHPGSQQWQTVSGYVVERSSTSVQ
jgi:DNA-binding LacI/PurR family transcriptional regulator/DNA-binding transcriptional regulator YhcF (GntR family)